ncbi:hypothetical protein [Mycobacterium sp. 852002-50816_SCH5313054-b]|uniref:hypothetical protein n=1 Tax=Mycobacterium sp. 852002-50816_SCH5313054-b TaxID=1834092 RepID=UPI000B0D894B|nr:hypothetical protein [Mycobacterium sp. 852002-50816_SCH5313054-b]
MTVSEARALTDKLKKTLADGEKMVRQLYSARADRLLDYTSWDLYVHSEFGGCMLRVPREERGELVRSLNLTMGLRPIAAALGISLATAQRAASGVSNETPGAQPKAKPVPKPDRFVQQYGAACTQVIEDLLEVLRLSKGQRFLMHRDALVKAHRENMTWGGELWLKLLPHFESDVTLLDE